MNSNEANDQQSNRNREGREQKIPTALFFEEEIDTIVRCIKIFTSERYVSKTDFSCLTLFDKSQFAATMQKLESDSSLDAEDGRVILDAVLHVASFPVRNSKEMERQFDVKMFQLYWFAFYIKDLIQYI